MSAERLKAIEGALHKLQEQGAALEDLAEQLSLGVHVLEAEVAALGRELQARPPAPAEPRSTEPLDLSKSADVDGARLVALNMALGGEPREVTARYLAERFELADLDGLLDDVYDALGSSTSSSPK